ncbi:MFS transporter [Williamsia sp. Leaf354]|uniref:MFS transporter n=1 Tax=Williamsia sp. Leaf354 TaxID=1736349 RepID=UPI000A3F3FA9|nr:MFS transporter [Williamsia sp. Leaf354]
MSPTPTSATVSNDVVGSALVEADLETPTAAPEPTRSRLSFWLVTAATALALAASGTPSPLYVDYQAKWGFSATTVTLIYGIYAGGVLVALLTMGGLSDRIGRRPVMIGSIGVLAASMVVFVFADNVGWLYVARAIQGVATGVFTGAAGAALSELHFRRDHRIASLVNSTATASGIAFGAVLTGMLAQWAPARLVLPYLVVAGLSVLVLIGIAIWVPETVTARQSLRSSLFRLQRLSLPAGIRREFAIGGLSVTAAWSVGGLYLALGGTLAKELLHVNNHLVAGLVILAVQGVGGLGQLVWNLSRPTASIRSSALVGSAALIVGLVLASIALATSSSAVFFIGAVATGVGFGLAFMSGTRRVTQVAPDAQRGEVLAAYFVIAYIAISVPAIIAGLVSTHLGITETFYWFAGITSVIAAIVFVAGLVEGKQSIRK